MAPTKISTPMPYADRKVGGHSYLAHDPSLWRVNLVVRPDVVVSVPATAVFGGVDALFRCERILRKVEGSLVVGEAVEEGKANTKVPKACEQPHGCDSRCSGYGGWFAGLVLEGLLLASHGQVPDSYRTRRQGWLPCARARTSEATA